MNNFNWSKFPSREGITSVFIASSDSYAKYEHDIDKAELVNALYNYNTINDLLDKKHRLRSLLMLAIVSIPFCAIFYNIFIGVWR